MSELPGRLFQGVFGRVLQAEITPELRHTLGEAGLDLAALEAHYPRALWFRSVALTAAALFPDDAPPEQLRRLGHHLIAALQSRGIIKAPWLTMARLLGPRRALRQAMDFLDRSPVKVTLTERSKSEFEIFVDADQQPEFFEGLFDAALLTLGAKKPVVRALPTPGRFLASWS